MGFCYFLGVGWFLVLFLFLLIVRNQKSPHHVEEDSKVSIFCINSPSYISTGLQHCVTPVSLFLGRKILKPKPCYNDLKSTVCSEFNFFKLAINLQKIACTRFSVQY